MSVRLKVAGSVMAGLVAVGGFAVGAATQSSPAREVRPVQSATATATQALAPCKEEDGSGQALPCRWDASTSGNGVGLSFTVRRAADGGTTYIYDNGKVDHVPPA